MGVIQRLKKWCIEKKSTLILKLNYYYCTQFSFLGIFVSKKSWKWKKLRPLLLISFKSCGPSILTNQYSQAKIQQTKIAVTKI